MIDREQIENWDRTYQTHDTRHRRPGATPRCHKCGATGEELDTFECQDYLDEFGELSE